MAKVAFLLPQLEICELTRSLLPEYPELSVMSVEYIQTANLLSRAKELEAQGCELIVARGVQAQLLRESLDLTVIEIVATTQELGLALSELKDTLQAECPRVGLICFSNMVSDISHFNRLFGVELRPYLVKTGGELAAAVDLAKQDGCVAVIGGDIVCERARKLGLICSFFPTNAESLRNALATVSRVSYAMEQQKRNSAEMDAMLAHTFIGIMQINRHGRIMRINRAGYEILGATVDELPGRPVREVIPALSNQLLDNTLVNGNETYAISLEINRRTAVVNITPIFVDNIVEGAILTIQEGHRIIEMDSELRRELYQRGYVARYSFDNIICRSSESENTIKLAKRIAKYSAPILLTGESGCGKGIMAQCIHKESFFCKNAFVPVDCSAWMPETLDGMLFGSYTTRKDAPACIAELVEEGTLYLSHVESLLPETQYKLLNLIRGRFMHNGSNRSIATNVRVIASCDSDLISRVEKGEFRRDLYYALNVLSIDILPLRRRREDIAGWVEFYLAEWQEKYKRFVYLTNGARRFIEEYDWPGNLDQINSVCERIVLLTEKRNIDEMFLRKQLEQVTPKIAPAADITVMIKDQKAVEIAQALKKHSGNREKAAAELGISKTTLWRHMKKYGIEQDFSC